MIALIEGSGADVDVYRCADDGNLSGSTIEIRANESESGETFVVIYETAAQ